MPATQLAARTSQPARTALYALHAELGAKFVSFAGFSMPLNFTLGILAEHRHTRTHASLFDVSHMSRFRVQGADAVFALESICPADLVDLQSGRLRYSVMTNDTGGIVDDIMIRRAGQDFEIIANAANRDTNRQWLTERLGTRCQVTPESYYSLLALQGPAAAAVLHEINPAVDSLRFMQAAPVSLAGIDCLLARAGYTGEDGFEISVPVHAAEALARRLLKHTAVQPAGLGARDGLRLEAGLPLYGQELTTATSPVEAGLAWTIAKPRREGGQRAGGFPGSERIFQDLKLGAYRRLTGLLPDGRAPLRTGTSLIDGNATAIGQVTSGGYSPTLERPIALAYIEAQALDRGIPIFADVRGKSVKLQIARPPFVAHRYLR